jgi:hypothetical protein
MSQPGDDPYPPVVPAPGRDARAPGVDRDIYGMPAFVSLAVRDIEAARDWYTRGLDFNLVVFTAPRPPEDTDPAFSARIRDLADDQLGSAGGGAT